AASAEATEQTLGEPVRLEAGTERHLELERAPLTSHPDGRPREVPVELDAGDAAAPVAAPSHAPYHLLDERGLDLRRAPSGGRSRLHGEPVTDQGPMRTLGRGKG